MAFKYNLCACFRRFKRDLDHQERIQESVDHNNQDPNQFLRVRIHGHVNQTGNRVVSNKHEYDEGDGDDADWYFTGDESVG